MSHRIIHDRRSRADFNLERERHKLKMERIKLERDKAELLKLERESHRSYDRDRHDEKRIRSVKRSYNDDSYNDDKRFEDYNRLVLILISIFFINFIFIKTRGFFKSTL